jgi:hypothetical protein
MIKFEDVTKAYSGDAGRCMCGCSGTYFVPSHVPLQKANAAVGYDAYDEHNDSSVKRIVNKINKAHKKMDKEVVHLFSNENFAYADVGKRTYTVYFEGIEEEL